MHITIDNRKPNINKSTKQYYILPHSASPLHNFTKKSK
jgi:hypothetical protein